MKSISYILWGLAVVSLIAAAFEASMIWIAGPLLAFVFSYSLLHHCLYRPPEDHLGVFYQFDRFSRLVGPDDWVFTIPGIHQIKDPIGLHVRRVEVTLSDLLTKDQVPVDCNLLVYYRLDLRCADADFRSQALRIPDGGWHSIIRTILQETANEVISSIPFRQLLTPSGRGYFKRTLNALLGERVERLGLVIKPQTGISVQVLKPAEAIWQAMVDRFAAVSLGEAALARIQPMLEELSQRHPEVGWEALLLEWAALMVRDGTIPQVLVAPTQVPAHAALPGKDRQQLDGRPVTDETASSLNGRREANLARLSAQVGGVTSP